MKVEQPWAPVLTLPEKVLLYLRRRGSKTWDEVYVHFDHGETGEIGGVLRVLEKMKQIELDKRGRVNITKAGLERLSAMARTGGPSYEVTPRFSDE